VGEEELKIFSRQEQCEPEMYKDTDC